MPFQFILPWLVMLPMLYGAALINIPMFLAFLIAAIGLSVMQIVDITSEQSDKA